MRKYSPLPRVAVYAESDSVFIEIYTKNEQGDFDKITHCVAKNRTDASYVAASISESIELVFSELSTKSE